MGAGAAVIAAADDPERIAGLALMGPAVRNPNANPMMRLEVRTPTLVVMGEQDPDFPDAPAEGRWVVEQLRGELLLVPQAGHYQMAQRPEMVNPVLVPFVGKVFAGA